MKRLRIGLNGFGRIGRAFTRIAFARDLFDIVAINTRKTPADMLAYLLKYDSVYRTYDKNVTVEDTSIIVDGKKIITTQIVEPQQIPWDTYNVDIVIDATGAFTTKPDLAKHIKGSVKKVILTAPAKDEETDHVVLGVNDKNFDFAQADIISNCSCTTNCVAPLFKVIDDRFTIVSGFLTTAHAYTATQSLLDEANKNKTRSRAAAINMVPATTGATKAVVKTLPHLKGKIDGMALRVPVPTVSFSDISVIVKQATNANEVNKAFKDAAEGPMKKILGYETIPLVSSDYIGSAYSVVFDANYTNVIGGTLIKVCGWYDNEWGYSTRLVDLVEKLAGYIP